MRTVTLTDSTVAIWCATHRTRDCLVAYRSTEVVEACSADDLTRTKDT